MKKLMDNLEETDEAVLILRTKGVWILKGTTKKKLQRQKRKRYCLFHGYFE